MIESRLRRSRLVAIASAFPEYVWDREATARVLAELFPRTPRSDAEDVIERSGVEERSLVVAPDEFRAARDGAETLGRARAAAARLAERAARSALEASGLGADSIDALFVVADACCASPGLELELCEQLELRRNVQRAPLDVHGAAAGGAALALAASYAERGAVALVVVVACESPAPDARRTRHDTERTSANLDHRDHRDERDALHAAATIGHGAAAAVIAPDAQGWRFAALGSWLAPHASARGAGRTAAAHSLCSRHLPGALVRFLSEHERSLADVGLHVVHGEDRPSLQRYAELFRVEADALRFSRGALASHGDLGAAALPTMLAVAAADARERSGPSEVLAVAAGPGSRLEFLLFDRTSDD